jgi:antitoxin (DNA-binding transcriptional repressor) of toxin-antitoxin stability system
MEPMATLHMSEAEVAKDLHGVLAKVQQGFEIIIEQDERPVAVIRAQNRSGRAITEILQEAKRRNSSVTLDEEFGTDLEEIIASHQQPSTPPAWSPTPIRLFP